MPQMDIAVRLTDWMAAGGLSGFGVSVTSQSAKLATVTFDHAPTDQEAQAATARIATFDWSDAAAVAWRAARDRPRTDLLTAAQAAVAAIDAFLTLNPSSAAQVKDQVVLLSQVVRKILVVMTS